LAELEDDEAVVDDFSEEDVEGEVVDFSEVEVVEGALSGEESVEDLSAEERESVR
jgi:hypothetical protein